MKKTNKLYYLTVDGKTEKWYFEHLQKLINQNNEISTTVKFDIRIGQTIHKACKSIVAPFKVNAFHICDYESNEEEHVKKFKSTLKEFNTYKSINKNVVYDLGYTNFSFDLWIIIHKTDKRELINSVHRKNYIKGINKAYKQEFENLEEYKEEENFKKKILSQINITDVINAIERGKKIRKIHEDIVDKCVISGKFKYYADPPDMTINTCVEKILKDCEIIN